MPGMAAREVYKMMQETVKVRSGNGVRYRSRVGILVRCLYRHEPVSKEEQV